jgi:putative transposase
VTSPTCPWSRDIVYLVAILDLYNRKVMAWRTSNTLSSEFCVTLQEALTCFGIPKIFNTDHGSQFTAEVFTDTLRVSAISISMNGGPCTVVR